MLTLHRARKGFVVERTAVVNRIRGLLAEFGVVISQRVESMRRELQASCEALPALAGRAIRGRHDHLRVNVRLSGGAIRTQSGLGACRFTRLGSTANEYG